jgi:hypothetical protein
MRTDRRTDITKLLVALRNFAKARTNNKRENLVPVNSFLVSTEQGTNKLICRILNET